MAMFDEPISMKELQALEKVLHEFNYEVRNGTYNNILLAHLKYRDNGKRAVIAIYHVWDFFTDRELQFIRKFAERRNMVVEYHESDPGISWKSSVDIYFKERGGGES